MFRVEGLGFGVVGLGGWGFGGWGQFRLGATCSLGPNEPSQGSGSLGFLGLVVKPQK